MERFPDYSKVTKYVSQDTFQSSWFRDHLIPNDVLISTVGSIGLTAIMEKAKGGIAQNLLGFRLKEDYDALFFFYWTRTSLLHKQIRRVVMDAVQPSLKRPHLLSCRIATPPLPEQKKIASILTTADNLIEKTEALIKKYQAIKQGMMHDLFTRGIDAHGKLRATYESAPHLYKESELGLIPKEWEVETFQQLIAAGDIEGIQDGNHGEQHPKSSDFVDFGIPFVMANNLKHGLIDIESCYLITRKMYESLRIGFAKPGDVLLSHKGTVGVTAIVNETTPEIMLTPQVTYYRTSPHKRLLNCYLYYFLSCDTAQRVIQSLSEQTTRKYIGITEQKKLRCILPPMKEQELIAERLESVSKTIKRNARALGKLRDIKKGLMQDLLTGKVRVPLSEEERKAA